MRLATALFAGALAVHAGYLVGLRRGFRRARPRAVPPPATSEVPVSVVVAVRNEAARIGPLMDALSAQTHPAFEVVAVDDGSADETPALLHAWAAHDPRVRVLANTGAPGKKGALATGIAAARHDVLLRTDADCEPPPGWISALAASVATPAPTVGIGYARYDEHPGVLDRLVRYEMLVTGWLMAAAAGLGRPYMAFGANLACNRAAWEAAEGFAGHEHLASGDDDLFVQAAHRAGVAVVPVVCPDAIVPTAPPRSWRAWLRQKRRHASDGRHYPVAVQAHLALFHVSGHMLWLAPFVLGGPGAALLAAHLGLTAWALGPAARAFGERGLMAPLPLLELGYALYNAAAPVLTLRRPKAW
jgi:cellulose synthase/poly-beta-1,6-N-acetylglucosamine synthase-like glycosyltransferase